jgi:hypothetical protein
MIADLLLGVQIICTLIFGGSQFIRLLTTSQGVSISWFGFWLAFLLVNLVLGVRAHKTQPSRVTLQTIISYSVWTLMVTADLTVMIAKGTGTWDVHDTRTAVLAGLGIVVVLSTAKLKNLSITDPMVKGWLAVFFKGVPQLVLAYKIFLVGGGGLAGVAVLTGHITILTRLGQLYFSIKEAGWDRNRTGSAISELANEVSWVIATIVWLAS